MLGGAAAAVAPGAGAGADAGAGAAVVAWAGGDEADGVVDCSGAVSMDCDWLKGRGWASIWAARGSRKTAREVVLHSACSWAWQGLGWMAMALRAEIGRWAGQLNMSTCAQLFSLFLQVPAEKCLAQRA